MNKLLLTIDKDRSVIGTLRYVPPTEKLFDETWLQEVLIANPQILPTDQMEEEIGSLIPLGREVGLPSGYFIDDLYVTKSGLICLVETKLWRNPEAHREVVAQVIAYAKDLAKVPYDKFVAMVEKSSLMGKKEGFWERVAPHISNLTQIEFQSRIQNSLEHGRFLLLIVGEKIYPEVAMMVDAIRSAPTLEFRIRLVELGIYRTRPDEDWPLVIVPRIAGKTQEVTRAVVKIYYEEKRPEIEAEDINEPTSVKTDRTSFENALPKDYAEILMPQIDRWVNEGFSIYWGIVGLSIRLIWKGKPRSFIDIYPDSFALYSEKMLEKRGFPKDAFPRYLEEVSRAPEARRILEQGKRYVYYRNISVDEFRLILKATDKLLKGISGEKG
jgi:hypothetical protein